jgi:hypothetical protein
MSIGRVNAAEFISRYLGEPHDSDVGGEAGHQLFNAAHADICCPPTGHRISWSERLLQRYRHVAPDVKGCSVHGVRR